MVYGSRIKAKIINHLFQATGSHGTHYNDVITSAMASQITSVSIVYSTFCSGADKKNIKAPRHWPLCRELSGGCPAQKASNAENVSIG